MKRILRDNLVFLIPYFIFFTSSGIFLIYYSKEEIHLYLNRFHHSFFDYFFPIVTWLGNFISVIMVTFILCFIKYRYAVLVLVANIFSAALAQFLKHTIFSDVVRPVKFFEGTHQLNLLPGYDNHMYNSFPSGHATSAFTTFFCLALITKNNFLKFVSFICALAVGASRIYLSQHFLSDVFAGSIIGMVFSIAGYHYIFISEKSRKLQWLDKSILR